MVVRKILEATLVAGSTSVTFTDSDIPNSLLRVYCTRSALFPLSQTLSGNSVTVTYKPQDSNIGVALEIVKSGLDIVDDLVTDDSTKALSANQGYVLKGLIDGIVIPTVPENITDLDDVDVTDITAGQVLAWDGTKFINVDQSGGGSSNDYSTTETAIGKWIDNTIIYRCVFDLTSDVNVSNNAWYASGISITNLSKILRCFGVNSSGTYYELMAYHTSGAVNLLACRDGAVANVRYICIEYNKTS